MEDFNAFLRSQEAVERTNVVNKKVGSKLKELTAVAKRVVGKDDRRAEALVALLGKVAPFKGGEYPKQFDLEAAQNYIAFLESPQSDNFDFRGLPKAEVVELAKKQIDIIQTLSGEEDLPGQSVRVKIQEAIEKSVR